MFKDKIAVHSPIHASRFRNDQTVSKQPAGPTHMSKTNTKIMSPWTQHKRTSRWANLVISCCRQSSIFSTVNGSLLVSI